ncbi:MAG: hypothetical protein COU65_03930 [Candidatus Pacebacteria bacterium CG10_big_fil_rev_8_21_14_0_10_42_12]|nr:CAP domain-containing protein [Candidatus Paceibacterota bacterium]PIR62321.1 MAG: hypothetical protein COU65_03930 [Candidatus Pacebacteria bacterium CG10_big_fil_rev_8_21_14_0_10_42_12]
MLLKETLAHLFHPRRSNNHRPRILHPRELFNFVGLVIIFSTFVRITAASTSPLGSVLGYAVDIKAQQVVAETNKTRASLGLEPLTLNSSLSEAALSKGQHMLTNQYWSHVAPDGTEPWYFIKNVGYGYTVAGENLARDFQDTPDMISAWMASPTHKANIVNPEYKDIGVAVINGELLGSETTLVVQMFGTLRQEAALVDNKPLVPVANAVDATTEQHTGVMPTMSSVVQTTRTTNYTEEVSVITPLQLTKIVFLSIIVILMFALVYDAIAMRRKQVARTVGDNLGHIMLYLTVAILIIFFKGGVIG